MAKKAFTLIELLIVISIIAILASVVFVALDPLKRFQDARNSSRWADVTAVVSAIKVYQVDNSGSYPTTVGSMAAGTPYMIGATGCGNTCSAASITSGNCLDLSELVTDGYLGNVPISPNASGSSWTSTTTGYALTKASTGLITVVACDAENDESISVSK